MGGAQLIAGHEPLPPARMPATPGAAQIRGALYYDADGNPLFDEELEAALDAAEGVLARTDVLVEARHWEVVGR